MDKFILQEYDANKRLEMLRDNCERAEETAYVKNLSPDERKEVLEEAAQLSLKTNQLNEELAELGKSIREQIKVNKKVLKARLSEIKTNSREFNETCFLMPDFKEGMMGIYTSEGELINSRPLRPDEKQTRPFQLNSARN